MEIFGQYLTRLGVVSTSVLEETAQSQVIYGGRLGTTLLELGYLDRATLERHLSEYLAVPLPPAEWLEKPEPAALAALPHALVSGHKALPLRLEEHALHVAMLDPRDPHALDEIGFAAGRPVVPYVLCEARLLALLERHLQIPREVRFIELDDEMLHPSPLEPKGKHRHARPPPPSPEDEAAARERAALGMTPLDADDELIDSETFLALHDGRMIDDVSQGERAESAAPEACEEPEGETTPLGLEEIATLEAELARSGDRAAVIELALRIARRYARAAALFVVRNAVIEGLRVSTPVHDRPASGILLSTSADSALAAVAAKGEPHRAPAPRSGVDAALLRALDRPDAREILVLPVAIRGRVVNLLYADAGPDATLGDTSVAALEALCGLVSRAYEHLILDRKRRYR